MPGGPDGINGLAGLQTLSVDLPFAEPEDRLGDPADPRHGKRGESNAPPGWKSQIVPGADFPVRDPESGVFDDYYYATLSPGSIDDAAPYWDTAPYTHAAPWPSDPIGDGSIRPDNTARQLRQNYALRLKAGKAGFAEPYASSQSALQDDWSELWEIDPGNADLTDVPAQMKSGAAPGGRGGTDRSQSNAKQNEYGFDSAHKHRRYATGSIPGNYMWMRPGGRPMIKSLAGPARPAIGSGSQFQGDDLGSSFDYTSGAILQMPATEYQGPPQPYVAPQPTYQDDSPPPMSDYYGYGDYYGT